MGGGRGGVEFYLWLRRSGWPEGVVSREVGAFEVEVSAGIVG